MKRDDPTYSGPLMMITRAVVACCLLIISLSSYSGTVCADQVDDLLAGLPVAVESAETSLAAELDALAEDATPPDASPTVKGKVVASAQRTLPKETLSEKSWEVPLAEPSHAGLDEVQTPVSQPVAVGEGEAIRLVPEPSTIALATGALVYFLVFFRRRYAL